jgi:hypothetical protein
MLPRGYLINKYYKNFILFRRQKMTVILAVRNPVVMFSDSYSDGGDLIEINNNKTRKLSCISIPEDCLISRKVVMSFSEEESFLVGYCGQTQLGQEFFYWCERGFSYCDRPSFSRNPSAEITGLALFQCGTIVRFDCGLFPYVVDPSVPYYAVGAGRDFVLGALEAFSIEYGEPMFRSAIKIAIKLSPYCGDPIHALTF